MEVAPQLRDGELAWVLGVEVLQYGVECSAGNAQKAAAEGLEVRYDGASLLPLLLFFEVDNAVGDCEILAESPFVFGS